MAAKNQEGFTLSERAATSVYILAQMRVRISDHQRTVVYALKQFMGFRSSRIGVTCASQEISLGIFILELERRGSR